MERERGPLETELHELMRLKGLADPHILTATVTGVPPPDPGPWEQILLKAQLTYMEAILRLAREIDDLRESL